MRLISTSILVVLLLLAPAALVPPAAARSSKPRPSDAPPPPKGSAAEKEKKQPSQMARADLVEARYLARQLLQLGRRTGSPLSLLAAAEIFQGAPTRGIDADHVIKRGPSEEAAPLVPRRNGAAGDMVRSDVPDPSELFAEIRSLAQGGEQPEKKQLLALVDQLERARVSARGAVDGPLMHCDQLSRAVRLTYRVAYHADERAVLTINSLSRRQLEVTVLDPEGQVVVEPTEEALVSWYPRQDGTFRIQLVNRWTEPLRYCMETN